MEGAVNFIDAPTARHLPARAGAPRALILHGSGDTDLDAVVRYYRSDDGLGPHYLVDLAGNVYRFAPENRVAWHAAIKGPEAELYEQGWSAWREWHWPSGARVPRHVGAFAGYDGWRAQWPDLDSPLDLVTGRSPNAVSVGVELLSPAKRGPGIYTAAQYQTLAALVVEVTRRHGIPLDRAHVLGHSDTSPMRRTVEAGGYDPGVSFDWGRLWDLMRGR